VLHVRIETHACSVQRRQLLKQIVGADVCRLFHLHLQSIRDRIGMGYENMLEGDGNTEERRRRAARQCEQRFTEAALGATPKICQQPEGELCDKLGAQFSSAEALRGLLEDMHEVTLTRDMGEEELPDVMGESVESINDIISSRMNMPPHSRVGLRELAKKIKAKLLQKRDGPAKWYARLAAKALVVGVNYAQGWIVLRALRREAARRDQDMPKFPLF